MNVNLKKNAVESIFHVPSDDNPISSYEEQSSFEWVWNDKAKFE